jgi:hypothetical protein
LEYVSRETYSNPIEAWFRGFSFLRFVPDELRMSREDLPDGLSRNTDSLFTKVESNLFFTPPDMSLFGSKNQTLDVFGCFPWRVFGTTGV